MKTKSLFLPIAAGLLVGASLLFAAEEVEPPTAMPALPGSPRSSLTVPGAQKPPESNKLYSFQFQDSDLDIVLSEYSNLTDRTMLKPASVNAQITLKPHTKLTKEESLKALDAILAMHNIVLIPMGEKFYKVVQNNAPGITGHGLPITVGDDELQAATPERLVTHIIQLKNVEIPEVQNAIQHLMHTYGQIMALQQSNSLMITDTADNVRRIKELVEFLDLASAKIEPQIYELLYADATEIAAKLNEIVQLAQADQKLTRPTPAVGGAVPTTPPGVIRARVNQASPGPTQATIGHTEGGSAAIIQGSVKVMADERTNIIIIFSQLENFAFFDRIIRVLDVEVEPAISFEVIRLEYADAEEISGTLNDLVGAAQGGRASSSGTTSSRSSNRSLSRNESNTRESLQVAPKTSDASAISNLNKLSESTKILADKRTNAILLMGRKSDIEAIKNVVKNLDVMLEQVVIEAAIFEVGLTDSLNHGIQWLYQNQNNTKIGAWDGANLFTNKLSKVASSALTYGQLIPGINTSFAINLAKSDSNARLLATPVIMTTDNTEASLSIGEQRPVVTSTSSFANSSGTRSSQYEYKDIGIQLTVTPRINPERMVIMEIEQQADQLGGSVKIDGNEVPVILNREFKASISVPDGGTVALGGLITTEKQDSLNKIPLLGDIPFLGRYLFSSVSENEVQRELIILMTPYVLTNNKEMLAETERLYKGTVLDQRDWNGSWSRSNLRNIDKRAPLTNQTERIESDAVYYAYPEE
jgi:general secretion pathway protein D